LLTEVVAYLQTSTLYLSGCIWHVVRPFVASCALTVLETAPAWTVGITRVLHTIQFRHKQDHRLLQLVYIHCSGCDHTCNEYCMCLKRE
jgi:hypothetical protein